AEHRLIELGRTRRRFLRSNMALQNGGRGDAIRRGIHREAEGCLADPDRLAVLQHRLAQDRLSVHPRAIESPEISDKPASFFQKKLRMPARGVFIVQDDEVVAVPAHRDCSVRRKWKYPGLAFLGFNNEARSHASSRLLGEQTSDRELKIENCQTPWLALQAVQACSRSNPSW